jgi:predicted nucleic acid-binding protein
MYLLDTNIISAFRRPDRLPQAVRTWADAADAGEFFLSAITVLEIEQGILAKSRTDTAQGAILRTWFDEDVLPGFEDRILLFDARVARKCASLHVSDPRPERDAMIAATAIVHGLTVVTRNIADFERLEVELLNPWTTP